MKEAEIRLKSENLHPWIRHGYFFFLLFSKKSLYNIIENLDKIERRALRRIEYNVRPEIRLGYDELRVKYKIESLSIRRKRSLLCIMYDKSKNEDNLEVISHDINLRSRGKVKMKSKFTGLTKLQLSPYYRGVSIWSEIPEKIQKVENKNVFKQLVKKEII